MSAVRLLFVSGARKRIVISHHTSPNLPAALFVTFGCKAQAAPISLTTLNGAKSADPRHLITTSPSASGPVPGLNHPAHTTLQVDHQALDQAIAQPSVSAKRGRARLDFQLVEMDMSML